MVVIEWADIIEEELPKSYIEVRLNYCEEENKREIEITAVNNSELDKEIEKYVNTGN